MYSTGSNNFDLSFSKNNLLLKLIYINLAVFIAVIILRLPFWLMGSDLNAGQWTAQWFAVPSNLSDLIYKPWTIISYMFLHQGFWHLAINMLWLYFLGQLFVQFLGERKLLTLYLAGGIAGALLYIISFNVFPVFQNVVSISRALGASASVMAIVIGLATHIPNYSIRLFLIGDVKLKYIALIIFIIDLAGVSNSNSGGHIAHIGGAIMGYLFAKQWAKGNDITAWAGKAFDFINALFKSTKKQKLSVKYRKSGSSKTSSRRSDQEEVDRILDKISKSGYDSLSKEEKDLLFRASNK